MNISVTSSLSLIFLGLRGQECCFGSQLAVPVSGPPCPSLVRRARLGRVDASPPSLPVFRPAVVECGIPGAVSGDRGAPFLPRLSSCKSYGSRAVVALRLQLGCDTGNSSQHQGDFIVVGRPIGPLNSCSTRPSAPLFLLWSPNDCNFFIPIISLLSEITVLECQMIGQSGDKHRSARARLSNDAIRLLICAYECRTATSIRGLRREYFG